MTERVVLSTEPDSGAFRLLEAAFQETAPGVRLFRTQDSHETLAFLHQTGPFADAPRPDLVLLNADSSSEILHEMARTVALRDIRSAVIGSSAEVPKLRSPAGQEQLPKPSSIDELLHLVEWVCRQIPAPLSST